MQVDNTTIAGHGLTGLVKLSPQHKYTGELVWIAFGLTYWFHLIRKYSTSPKAAGARKMSYSILLVHIVTSLTEMALYYIPLWRNQTIPIPSALHLGLCAIQSVSSLYLAAVIHRTPRGNLEITRATFQAMAFQRMAASALAYHTQSAAWSKASIKLLQNFIWARFLIVKFPVYLSGMRTATARYTVGVVGCHFMGMWEGGYPNGIGVYMGLMAVLLALDRQFQEYDSKLKVSLTTLGFVTRTKEPEAIETTKKD